MKDQDKTTEQLIRELQAQREEIAVLEKTTAELRQRQQSLTEQLRIQELLTELCTEVVNLPVEEVDSKIEYSLMRLAKLLGHDRTSLRRYVEEESELLATHWWAAEGIDFPPKVLPNDKFPYLTRTLRSGKVFVFSTLEDLPKEARLDRKGFETSGQKSALAIPLRLGGTVIGGMTFSSFTAERNWPHPLIRRLALFGEVVANAIAWRGTEQEFGKSSGTGRTPRERLHVRNARLSREVRLRSHTKQIIGRSQAIKKVLDLAEQVAGTDSTVLIIGETGTGKELLAHAIHDMSSRRNRTMVTVNCSALPSNLIESELFGRERGAFTGACSKEIGRFELGHGSTLFLDEIGDLAIEAQPRLLRVIQDGRFERVGSPKTVRVDTRIIAATNKDLAGAAKAGTFRKDLYYRLNVFPIVLPPLRYRKEDIPELVWSFVRELEQKLVKRVERIPSSVMKDLQDYHWPGNIRELRNTIERAMLTVTGPTLNIVAPADSESQCQDSEAIPLEEMEKNHILKVLATTGGRVKGNGGAAQILRINPSTLFSRMRRLGIRPVH